MGQSYSKVFRLLNVYSRLKNGEILNKSELAQQFQVTPKSIQRDIDEIRCYLANEHDSQEIKYDNNVNGYYLTENQPALLTNDEILAVCKILISSRSLRNDEMEPILDKLLENCVPAENYHIVKDLISNEKFHYLQPHHAQHILPYLWTIGTAITQHCTLHVEYERLKDHSCVSRQLNPVGLMFSEYYFYMAAFINDIDKAQHFDNPQDIFPTIYRLDRIKSIKSTDLHFDVPYKDRFEEGQFRKRIQFMYGGRLQKIRFRYTGLDINSVLDRIPTAQIISKDDLGYDLEAEIFGTGIDMWIKSQGDSITLLSSK